MNKEIISTNEEDKPLIWISEKAINLYKDNKKLLERIDKALECIYDMNWTNCEVGLNQVADILKGEDNE